MTAKRIETLSKYLSYFLSGGPLSAEEWAIESARCAAAAAKHADDARRFPEEHVRSFTEEVYTTWPPSYGWECSCGERGCEYRDDEGGDHLHPWEVSRPSQVKGRS